MTDAVPSPKSSRWKRPLITASIVTAFILLTRVLPASTWLLSLAEWLRKAGVEGSFAYLGFYAFGALFFAPIAAFNAMAGYAYGPYWGMLLASPASAIAACSAFLAGRFLFRKRMQSYASRHRIADALIRAVNKRGFRLVLMLRIALILPQNVLHYVLSLASIRLRTFFLATWIGLTPAVALQVYAGSLVTDVSQLLKGGIKDTKTLVFMGGGLLASLIVLVFVARMAKKAVDQALHEHRHPTDRPPS